MHLQWDAKVLDPHYLSTNQSPQLHESFTMHAPTHANIKIVIKIAKSRVAILQLKNLHSEAVNLSVKSIGTHRLILVLSDIFYKIF